MVRAEMMYQNLHVEFILLRSSITFYLREPHTLSLNYLLFSHIGVKIEQLRKL